MYLVTQVHVTLDANIAFLSLRFVMITLLHGVNSILPGSPRILFETFAMDHAEIRGSYDPTTQYLPRGVHTSEQHTWALIALFVFP